MTDMTEPRPLAEAVPQLPTGAGVYAFWAAPSVLPDLPGPASPTAPGLRLLYVGLASDLRRRIARSHLNRSGTSTLRRVLAGLLMEAEGYRTRWTDRVELVPEDERRLTDWMNANLWLAWCEVADPEPVELRLIVQLRPPLNVNHSPAKHPLVLAARERYLRSARKEV